MISGCGMLSGGDGVPSRFRGTTALTMSFIKGLPPDEVYSPLEGELMPFQAAIEMHNQGAHDIEGGFLVFAVDEPFLRITGWDRESEVTPIGASGERIRFSLQGRSDIDPFGQNDLITVNLLPLSIGEQRVQHRSSIVATVCYPYRTELSRDVCIDTDIYGIRPTEKTCEAQDVSVSGGQGAPVEVTLIEVKMLPGENYVSPQFIIHVKNSGGGQVIDPDAVSDACSSLPLTFDNVDVIDIDEVSFSRFSSRRGQIECFPETIKLRNGQGNTRCQLRPGLMDAENIINYRTPLYIELSYGYYHTLSKEIVIRNILAE
ncbi:hypothetical protein GF345_03220 [Candidatus Woesearchaeota archaeon]|nr:hypothetical protein [Candidatus Woesearchaeota archaeon]